MTKGYCKLNKIGGVNGTNSEASAIVRTAHVRINHKSHWALRQGDKLPSVREMALIEGLNPNTVAKAYRRLQQAGSRWIWVNAARSWCKCRFVCRHEACERCQVAGED